MKLLLALVIPILAAAPAAADLSILYQPARSIAVEPTVVVCEADSFRYRLDRPSGDWEIEKRRSPPEFPPPGNGDDEYQDNRRGAEYRFITEVGNDEVRLEVQRDQDGKDVVLAELEIYDRSRVVEAWYPIEKKNFPSRSAFSRQVQLSRPRVTGVNDDGRFLWVSLGYSVGEGHYGIGTLVRVDALLGEVVTFQPPALATSSLTHVTTGAYAVWLGTLREDETRPSPTFGLVRFDPVTERTESYLPHTSPITGEVITALVAEGDTLWLGTDEAICRFRVLQNDWTCWRLIPQVRIRGQAPVSNRPGETSPRRLLRGTYEVRWATVDSLEVITRDHVEGWLPLGPREELPVHNHYADIYELATQDDPRVDRWVMFDEPGDAAGVAAEVYRIDPEKVALRTANGWQRVKVRAGWIPGAGLEVVPDLALIESE